MASLKSNVKRNNSYVESIDDSDYISISPTPLSFSPTTVTTTTIPNGNSSPRMPQNPGPIIFHRRMYSADGFGNSAPTSASSFEYSSTRSNTFDHSSPPNYYQLALQQEEENRRRQDLFSLIYSSTSSPISPTVIPPTVIPPIIAPPNHPPPSIPTPSSLDSPIYNNQQKLRIDNSVLNNNLRPPSFKHLRSVSTDASFESSSNFSNYQQKLEKDEEEFENGLNFCENYSSDIKVDFESSFCEDSFNELNIDLNNFLDNQIERMKPPLEMAKEKRKLVVLNDLEKSSKDFSLSVDENFSPQEFKTINSPSTSASSIPNSPRSRSAPPKHPHRNHHQRETPKNEKHLKIDEESAGNSHELSLFFCSPTVSNSFDDDISMELMNTSEMINDDNDNEEGEGNDVNLSTSSPAGTFLHSHSSGSEMVSPKPVNFFTFDEADIVSQNQQNIQSRPLPPLPDEDGLLIPDEPEDMAPELEIPEPEYACVDDDIDDQGYAAIHHQRSVSDHVLSCGQRQQIDDKMKAIDFLKKSNSDRSERRSTRKKPISLEQPPSSEEEEHRKLSDISEHRKTISCSTPSFLQPSSTIENSANDETDDARKRSITTDSIQSPPGPALKQIIPSGASTVRGISTSRLPPCRKISDQQFSGSVRLRDSSKSVSTIGSADSKQRFI